MPIKKYKLISNFSNYNKNILELNISNLQRLPVEIYGIEFADGNKIFLKKPSIDNFLIYLSPTLFK